MAVQYELWNDPAVSFFDKNHNSSILALFYKRRDLIILSDIIKS